MNGSFLRGKPLNVLGHRLLQETGQGVLALEVEKMFYVSGLTARLFELGTTRRDGEARVVTLVKAVLNSIEDVLEDFRLLASFLSAHSMASPVLLDECTIIITIDLFTPRFLRCALHCLASPRQ